jgi:hypothetical protein
MKIISGKLNVSSLSITFFLLVFIMQAVSPWILCIPLNLMEYQFKSILFTKNCCSLLIDSINAL